MALNTASSRRYGEMGFAAALVAAAGLFFFKAGEYPELAGTYPRVLSVLLALGGLAVLVRTMVQGLPEDAEPLFTHPVRFVLGFAILGAYVLAISLIGYVIPSLVLGMSVPLILGYRNIRLAALVTLGTLVFILLVFVVVLGRPIPRDVLDPLLVFLR